MRSHSLKAVVVTLALVISSAAYAQRGGDGGGSGGGTGGDPSIMQLRNNDGVQRLLAREFQRREHVGLCRGAVCEKPKRRVVVQARCRGCHVPEPAPEPVLEFNSESCTSGAVRWTMVQGHRRYTCDDRRFGG